MSEKYIKVSDIGKVSCPYHDYGVPFFTAEEIMATQWRSVDNLPDVPKWETLCILVTDGKHITDGCAVRDDFGDEKVCLYGRFPIDDKDIKWWMPLPELPKKEMEE